MISEFNEKNQTSYSHFSLQVQPLEKDLFASYMLVYTGGSEINSKGLLWKVKRENTNDIPLMTEFYINKSDIENEKVKKSQSISLKLT